MYRGGLEENREATELGSSMTPLKRIGTPEELAYTVVMLCADKAGYMTCITVAVDGGWSQH
ncbi:MAG: SDR family oxidoreductase [Rhodococcus sp.]|nr:SDR family oxidoreductase [Rhodococcus sp. (in: high G+C Gram-positive bacteria)]